MDRTQRILVTGSSGRIGAAICHAARRLHDVTGVDRVPGPQTTALADLRDETRMTRLLEGVDAVLHVAALHAPHVGTASEDEFYEINVRASRALARSAVEAGVGRFVFTSSTAVYGAKATASAGAEWIDARSVPRPRTIYHRSKLAAEAEIAALAGERFRVGILRMSRCFPEPAPAMAVYRLNRGIDVRDVADAHIAALGAKSPACAVHIVSATTPFSREDCAQLAADAEAVLARRCPRLVTEFRRRGWQLPQALDRVYDNSQARHALGWAPIHGYETVLRQLDCGDPEVLVPE